MYYLFREVAVKKPSVLMPVCSTGTPDDYIFGLEEEAEESEEEDELVDE